MAKILITGSADGLGLMAGRLLTEQGHDVVLHARNARRADDARAARCPAPRPSWRVTCPSSPACGTSPSRPAGPDRSTP